VDICKDGYITYSQNITLNKKESRSIIVPELIRKKGNVLIETNPIGFYKAYIDGNRIEHFPIEIEMGNHYLLLQAYGCDTIKSNINVIGDQDNRFTYNLFAKNKYYERAYQGDLEILMALAINKIDFRKTEKDLEEGKFWLSMIISKIDSINPTFLSRDFSYNYDFKKCIGEVTGDGYPNYRVLFNLFMNSHVNDYAGVMTIIEKCESLEKEFDHYICYLVGEACMKTNRKKDALLWLKKCINRYNGRGNMNERAQKLINEIERNGN
jgi:hypothetical protein